MSPSRWSRPGAGALPARKAFLELGKLLLEVAVALPALRREPTVAERLLDGAARLRLVTAVAEPAACLELGDVRERVVETLVREPEMDLPHPRVVHEQAAVFEQDEQQVTVCKAAQTPTPAPAEPGTGRFGFP